MDYSKYVNQMEYPKRPVEPIQPKNGIPQLYREYADALDIYNTQKKEYNHLRQKYNEKDSELYAAFKVDALKEVGLWGHEAGNRAFELAWDKGHANGYSEVFIYLEQIAYVVLGPR